MGDSAPIVVYYDPCQGAHSGASSSAECPARIDESLRFLESSRLAIRHISFRPLDEPLISSQHWPAEFSRNCSSCTFALARSCETCEMCGSPQVHDWRYVGKVDGDTTYESPGTLEIVERASRLVATAVSVVTGPRPPQLALCLTRPPGHHACSGRRVGFCHQNFAVNALDALHTLGHRVAILDVDAHHGDGTEVEVLKRAHGTFVSLHGFGPNVYPGTGASSSSERVTNVALPPEADTDAWLAALRDIALPAVLGAMPDVVVLSLGLDGHVEDSLAPLQVCIIYPMTCILA